MPVTIANRSRSGVIKRLRGLRPSLNRNLWLPGSNAFRLNTLSELHTSHPIGNPGRKQLADYISVSAFLHMADAWSFLSRASIASISGDNDVAVHLGYYAELRACMSILAAQGVGVFDAPYRGNQNHYIVTSNGHIQSAASTKIRTHVFCWDAFRDWVNSSGWNDICSTVRPGGASLSDWLTQMPAFGPAVPLIGTNAVLALGIDVARLGQDRNLRNEASYRPTALRYLRPQSPADEVSRCASAAEAMIAGGSFGDCSLSRAMLAKLSADTFQASTGSTAGSNPAGFSHQIQSMVGNVAHTAGPNIAAELIHLANHPPQLIADAFGSLPVTGEGHHAQVLARATVLCFLASTLAQALLRDAGITAPDLAFWMDGFAMDRGVYNRGLPNPATDLWTDLQDAINDARANVVSANPPQSSVFQIDGGCISSLCRFERLAVLGLAT